MAPAMAADCDTKSEERTQVSKYNNYGFTLFALHKHGFSSQEDGDWGLGMGTGLGDSPFMEVCLR